MGTYYSEEDLKKMDEEASVGGFLKGAFKNVVDTLSEKPFHESLASSAFEFTFGEGAGKKFEDATVFVLNTGISDTSR